MLVASQTLQITLKPNHQPAAGRKKSIKAKTISRKIEYNTEMLSDTEKFTNFIFYNGRKINRECQGT